MDLVYFLKQRTDFIRQFYSEGRKPFDEIKRLIEAEEPPYVPPPFNPDYDDGEPVFLVEWMEADMAVHVMGLSCISMLSDTIKIFFKNLEREFGFKPTEEAKKRIFKPGFLHGYKDILSTVIDTDWNDCPADFDIIEQVVLARNRSQHSEDITGFRTTHDTATIKKHPKLFFVGEEEKGAVYDQENDGIPWFKPTIEVSQNDLFHAINEVEVLAQWIWSRQQYADEWRRRSG